MPARIYVTIQEIRLTRLREWTRIKKRTEPLPRNDCNIGLLGGGDGDRGRMKGDSSFGNAVRDEGDLGGVGVRVSDSEPVSAWSCE